MPAARTHRHLWHAPTGVSVARSFSLVDLLEEGEGGRELAESPSACLRNKILQVSACFLHK